VLFCVGSSQHDMSTVYLFVGLDCCAAGKWGYDFCPELLITPRGLSLSAFIIIDSNPSFSLFSESISAKIVFRYSMPLI
jgi:hypothetical protein